MTRPLLVLVGPPGAGKTAVGRALAEQLGVGFRDTDADVEVVAGKPVADVFVEDGEARFRELEKAAVAAALCEHDGVLSLGGGAVLAEQTRDLLRGHTVVLLDVDLPTAVQRVGVGNARPLVGLNPRAQLRQLLEDRRALYEEVAGRRVDTSGVPLQQVAQSVVAGLGLPD